MVSTEVTTVMGPWADTVSGCESGTGAAGALHSKAHFISSPPEEQKQNQFPEMVSTEVTTVTGPWADSLWVREWHRSSRGSAQ
jgi:hypothetical protein